VEIIQENYGKCSQQLFCLVFLLARIPMKILERIHYFHRPKDRRNKTSLFLSALRLMKKTRLVSSARLADENMTLFSSACVADENSLIFVGC
jgi:hypothetical protein